MRTLLEERHQFQIAETRELSGGDTCRCLKLRTSEGSYLLKLLQGESNGNILECEYEGLMWLKSRDVNIPGGVHYGNLEGTCYLTMDFIEPQSPRPTDWRSFGESLARLHLQEEERFGWEKNNFIGSVGQANTLSSHWVTFYAEFRINPLIERTQDLLSKTDREHWDRIEKRLPELISCEFASPLHGDLWSGNFLFHQGIAYLIDPAVSVGDRIMDIAMSRLFGGFDDQFYEAYFGLFPITQDELETRVHLYQLYYLLIHVAIFGSSYVPAVSRILKRFA